MHLCYTAHTVKHDLVAQLTAKVRLLLSPLLQALCVEGRREDPSNKHEVMLTDKPTHLPLA